MASTRKGKAKSTASKALPLKRSNGKPAKTKASTTSATAHLLKSAQITPTEPTWVPRPSGPKKKIKPEGWSTPFASSPYTKPPHPMDPARMICVEFEPDPEAAWASVPDPLQWAEGTTALCCIGDNRQMPTSLKFQEGMIVLKVKLGDELGSYIPYIWTSTDEAMIAAREVSGRPKLVCDHNELQIMGSGVNAKITRRGETIMRASVTLEDTCELKDVPLGGNWLSVRKVQMPEEGRPALKQVIRQGLSGSFKAHSVWRGRGFCELPGQAMSDIWKLNPKNTGRAWMIDVSWDLKLGKIVWENWVPAVVE
ncbi:MAG: acetoacetate decarboxylase family protein [Alphaproteobacteria bacterium]